tara:strand:- start:916 stop:1116 length:201 start_codon:yes stop_codon:yes gene_type:complete
MEYSKYERARIIGARALQIAMGAPLLMKMKDKDFNKVNFSPIEIAKREFDGGFLPITIKRPMPRKA